MADAALATDEVGPPAAVVAAPGAPPTRGAQYLQAMGRLSSNTSVNTIPRMDPPRPGIEQYAREGVPLDTTTGVSSFLTRAGLSFAESSEDKLTYLRNAYAGSKVEQTPDGQLIIRNVLDQSTGKPKDLLVDEQGVTLNDLADLTKAGLQTGVEIVATSFGPLARAAGALGRFGRVGAQSVLASSAGETFSTLTDLALKGQSADLGELLKSHAKQGAINTGVGAALGGALEAVVGARSFAKGQLTGELAPGPEERKGITALQVLQRDTGIEILPSVGQMAADPNVLRLESFLERLPFFGTLFREQRARQEASIRALQDKVIGSAPLQPLSELGADLVETVKSAVKQPQDAQALARTSIATRAADQLESAITQLAPTARPLTETGSAALTKFSARAQMGKFKQVADTLFSDAGNPEISTASLKPLLEEARASLPKRTVVTESELVDLAGAPLATTEGKELVRELVPAELQRFLKGLDTLDASMPLDQLRRIRLTVDNAITEGKGLEGVSTYELKKVQHAITETINEGARALPPAEGAALLRANAFYRENIERFEVPLVARLLKDTPNAPGYIANHELVDAIRSNPDRFNEIETFLKGSVTEGGRSIAASSEGSFNVLRRSILEGIYDRARIQPGSSSSALNPDAFIAELNAFKSDARAKLVGTSEETLRKNLELLRQTKEGYKSVPVDRLEAFLRYPANSVHDVSRLVSASHAEAALFENEVIGKLLKGETSTDGLRADQALDWLMVAKNKGDVAQVMALAAENPELHASLRANAAARLFQEVAQKTKPADAARLAENSRLVSPTKLLDRLRAPGERDKLRLILGDDTFNVIENFAVSQSVIGKEGMSSLLGSSTATSIMTNVLKLLAHLPQTVKFAIYSRALTDRNLQRAIMEASLNPATDVSAFTKALIASPPILNALGDQYGKSGTEMIIEMVRDSVDVAGTVRNEEGLKMRGEPRTPAAQPPIVGPMPGRGRQVMDAFQVLSARTNAPAAQP